MLRYRTIYVDKTLLCALICLTIKHTAVKVTSKNKHTLVKQSYIYAL